jgi:hypothetical protein
MESKEGNGKRKNHGRAARRRRRKVLEISKAEDAYTTGTTTTTTTTTEAISRPVLPTDRSQVREAVKEVRLQLEWKEEDELALLRQLGFVPGNAIGVCCRMQVLEEQLQGSLPTATTATPAAAEEPVVVQLYPLATRDEFLGGRSDGRKFKSRKRRRANHPTEAGGGTPRGDNDGRQESEQVSVLEPFPTMYWLTHPLLRIWVSKLEVNGYGVELEKRLASDPGARERMQRAHQSYGVARWRLLTAKDQAWIHQRKWGPALDESRGVAGIRNHAAVKCLHAHTAHYLAGCQDNLVGRWVVEKIRGMVADTKRVEEKEGSD